MSNDNLQDCYTLAKSAGQSFRCNPNVEMVSVYSPTGFSWHKCYCCETTTLEDDTADPNWNSYGDG